MCCVNDAGFDKGVREGWNIAAKELHGCGDDKLLIPDVFEDEEFEDLIGFAPQTDLA